MLHDDEELREAAQSWRTNRENFRALLVLKLETLNMTELSHVTGIKRTTLYYIIYGKDGKKLAAGN